MLETSRYMKPMRGYMNLARLAGCLCLSACLTGVSFAADAGNACTGNPSQWRQVFNGKDLTGWKHVGPGNMTVEDGLIQIGRAHV